jgi:hypothetical protein
VWYETTQPLAVDKIWFNFLPSWWHRNYGFTFGRRFVFDPDYRTDLMARAEKIVADRFARLGIGSEKPPLRITAPDFNNASTPAAVTALSVPEDLTTIFPYTEIISQVAYLNRKHSRNETAVLPVRGVLNDAALLSGISFFEDLAVDPRNAADLLNYTQAILMASIRNNAARRSTFMPILCNCTVMMVSPDFYACHLLPRDLEIYACAIEFGLAFGVHHCGLFDKYAALYRRFPRLDWLAIGWNSDLDMALSMFPESVIQYLISPTFMLNCGRREVENRISELLRIAGPRKNRLRLEVSDLEFGTPEENITAVYNLCR